MFDQILAKTNATIDTSLKSLSNWSFVASLVLAAVCWGFGTVMSKSVLAQVPPLTLLVVQLAVSLAFLWTIIAAQRLPVPLHRETWRLGLTGLLNPGLAYTLGLLGLTLTTASLSSLIWAAEPILILGLAWLILHERLTRPLIAFSVLAVIGALLIIGIGSNSGGAGSLLGNLLILAGVFCCAIYTVLTRRIVGNVEPVLLTALQQTFALVWALTIWPIELREGMTSLATISPSTWAWAAASGIVYYGLAFWFYIIGLKKIPASLAGFFLNLIPIFGVGGAYIFLNERLGAGQWAGAILILAAVVGVSRFYSEN